MNKRCACLSNMSRMTEHCTEAACQLRFDCYSDLQTFVACLDSCSPCKPARAWKQVLWQLHSQSQCWLRSLYTLCPAKIACTLSFLRCVKDTASCSYLLIWYAAWVPPQINAHNAICHLGMYRSIAACRREQSRTTALRSFVKGKFRAG